MVKIRRAYEVLFLGLFLFFLLITDLRYLKGWPVSLFLEATPLVAVSTALTTHTIYRNLVWGLVIIAVTMVLGRVWCNWMCPFGIMHHFFHWIGNRKTTKQLIEVNRYKKIYAIKYYILGAMLVMSALWIIPTAFDAPGQVLKAFRDILCELAKLRLCINDIHLNPGQAAKLLHDHLGANTAEDRSLIPIPSAVNWLGKMLLGGPSGTP